MANCKNCGAPLTKGNIQIVRPRGKKRPYRIHRRCPEPTGLAPMPQEAVEELVKPEVFTGKPDRGEAHSWKGETAGNVVQRPQDNTGGPLVAGGVFYHSEPIRTTRVRFFVQPASVEKLKQAIEKGEAWFWGFASNWSMGITIEIIPVLEEVAEMNPEALAHYVEVEFKWKPNE